MPAKQLFVASPVQIALLREVIIPQFNDGFWKDHRPAGHGTTWLDLDIQVTQNGQVGPFNFKVPRLYNFTNPEFMEACEERLIEVAQNVDPTLDRKKVYKTLNELSQIVGGRLTDLSVAPTKAFRGNNVPDERGDGNVLETGKGLGSEYWLESVNTLVAQTSQAQAKLATSHTYITLERGARKLRVFINGAGVLALEHFGGDVIACIETPEQMSVIIAAAMEALTSVNLGKEQGRDKSGGTTTVNNDTIVRRVPVVRPVITAAYTAADPFGLTV